MNVYQIAYVCGGPARVAMVALVGLYGDGQIAIARARRRVTVLAHDRQDLDHENPDYENLDRQAHDRQDLDHRDPVRAAAVASIPAAGRTLGPVLSAVAASDAVAEIGRALRDRGLLPGTRLTALWPSSRTRAGRNLRRRIVAGLPTEADDPRRVATMGSAGIGDPDLRQIFETAGPELSVPPVRLPGTRDRGDGYRSPTRGDGYEGGGPSAW